MNDLKAIKEYCKDYKYHCHGCKFYSFGVDKVECAFNFECPAHWDLRKIAPIVKRIRK